MHTTRAAKLRAHLFGSPHQYILQRHTLARVMSKRVYSLIEDAFSDRESFASVPECWAKVGTYSWYFNPGVRIGAMVG